MRGALTTAPLREIVLRRLRGGYTMAAFTNDWLNRFPSSNHKSVSRFIERLAVGENATVTRSRGDEAALVLGLMPSDVWGEEWWR